MKMGLNTTMEPVGGLAAVWGPKENDRTQKHGVIVLKGPRVDPSGEVLALGIVPAVGGNFVMVGAVSVWIGGDDWIAMDFVGVLP